MPTNNDNMNCAPNKNDISKELNCDENANNYLIVEANQNSQNIFKKILIDKNVVINRRIIFDAVTRTLQIIVHLYMFLHIFVLDKYHNDLDIPHINRDFISMAIKSLVLPCFGGPTPKGNSLKNVT